MEIEKEAFRGLMGYYKNLSIQDKRNEIVNEIEELIYNYSKICSKLGIIPNMQLNKEVLNINRSNLTEEEFLDALFAYLNNLEDISAQFINAISNTLENK